MFLLFSGKIMVYMDITVSKSEIFKEVEKRTSLEALGQEGKFESVWASSEEGKFLDTYWIEGYTAAVQVFKRYITKNTVTHSLTTHDADEVLTISVEMPERFNILLEGSIETDVKMMIAANVTYGWMNVKLPALAKKYEDESASYAEDLKQKILYRNEPVSKMQLKDEDDSLIEKDDSMLAVKDAVDIVIEKDDSMLAVKDADDTVIEKDDDGTMIHKGMDRLKLTQYHGCNDYFKQGRDYGRRNECGPCDWQEGVNTRAGRQSG